MKGIFQVKDIREELHKLYDGVSHTRYSTGFDELDPLLRIVKPSFLVWTGTPNSGKSSLIYDIIIRMSKKDNFKWCVYSPEHSLGANLKRLVEKFTQKPFDKMFTERASGQEVSEALEFIANHFFFLDGVGETPDIDWILERAKFCADEFKIDGIVLDPYNEINPARNNLREDEHISLLISKIKRFNRENDVVTFLVAHPTKQIRQPDGQFRVNSLYDISGSAHFNNKADAGVIVSRDFELEQTTVRVEKIREIDVQGNIGECIVKWCNKTRCFHSPNSDVFKEECPF
jgi:twinkle protein